MTERPYVEGFRLVQNLPIQMQALNNPKIPQKICGGIKQMSLQTNKRNLQTALQLSICMVCLIIACAITSVAIERAFGITANLPYHVIRSIVSVLFSIVACLHTQKDKKWPQIAVAIIAPLCTLNFLSHDMLNIQMLLTGIGLVFWAVAFVLMKKIQRGLA